MSDSPPIKQTTNQQKQIMKTWTQDKEWKGNPALGMKSFHKKMRTEYRTRKVPVYVYGGGIAPHDGWGNYCVSAGADSELSHSGFIPDCKTAEDVMRGIDLKFASIQ